MFLCLLENFLGNKIIPHKVTIVIGVVILLLIIILKSNNHNNPGFLQLININM